MEAHLEISLFVFLIIFWLLHNVKGILEQLSDFPDSCTDLKDLCVFSAWIYLPGK